MNRFILLPMVLAGIAFAAGAPRAETQNLYPDPGFERQGLTGKAHTGRRAGFLEQRDKTHWIALGDNLSVQPFATYRASCYARCQTEKGVVYSPYCYEWDSFGWAFVKNQAVKPGRDWQRHEVTFISPKDTMVVHPLAFLDVENAKGWVDDVVVERVLGPQATMDRLLSLESPSEEQKKLIVRYHLSQGKRNRAKEMMKRASAYLRADIAFQLGTTAETIEERIEMLQMLVANGGLTYPNGGAKFNELSEGLSLDERLQTCAKAVIESGGSQGACLGFSLGFRAILSEGTKRTCAETREILDRLKTETQALLSKIEKREGKEVLLKLSEELHREEKELQVRKSSLGRCVVLLQGEPVTPKTYCIVLPENPTPQEEHAAKDLRMHWEQVTGDALKIVREGSPRRAPHAFFIGRCRETESLGIEVDYEKLGLEGIRLAAADCSVVLTGNKRGVLYACSVFLEDYLGCRWFTPDCSTTPREGTFDISSLDVTYVPFLEYRATDYPNSRDADWAVRNRVNGTQTALDEKRGGKIAYSHFVHTFNSLLNPDEWFAVHPEYFSQVGDARLEERTQLCLTNPEVLHLSTQRVKQWMRDAPHATFFSVSQNDWHNWCQCERCTALAKREGSQSGPILHFVNAIAEDVEETHPDKVISTLAYQYSRKAPRKIKPRPNVTVRLCSIECCFSHPLKRCSENRTFARDLRKWSRICDRLSVWDYVISYAHSVCPFPNLYVLQPNIQFFIQNGVTSLYEEANYFSKGGEFAELRTYIMAKTLWDPSYDTEKAIREFCAGYYGAAGPFIQEYVRLIHEPVKEDKHLHLRIWTSPDSGHLSDELLAEADRLFDAAENAVASSDVRLHRVRVARLPVLYAQIHRSKGGYRREGNRLILSGEDPREKVERFAKTAQKEGLTRIRENRETGNLNTWLASQSKPGEGVNIVTLQNEVLQAEILPGLGGRIWSLKHLPTGVEFLRSYGDSGDLQPGEGGYEEYTEFGYRTPGWNEAYTETDVSQREVSVESTLRDGLRVRRTYSMDESLPALQIRTELYNQNAPPKKRCIRVHPEFLVHSFRDTYVLTRSTEGRWIQHSLVSKKDPSGPHEKWFLGEEMPAGEWALAREKKGLALYNLFDPRDVSRCYIHWYGEMNRANLEMWSQERVLKQGESLFFQHRYEIRDMP